MFTEAVLLTPFARSTKMTARIDAMTPPAETETAEGSALPAPPMPQSQTKPAPTLLAPSR